MLIMNWFKNLKVGSKLVLSFTLLLVIAVIVGVFLIIEMRTIENDYSEAMTRVSSAYANAMSDSNIETSSLTLSEFDGLIESNRAKADQALLVALILLFVMAIATSLVAIFIPPMITKPLLTLVAFMDKASSTGDLSLSDADHKVIGEYGSVKDEIGWVIRSCAAFVMHITDIAKELETIAEGDFTTAIKVLSDDDTMGGSLVSMIDNLNNMFCEINNTTIQVATGSKQIADSAQALAQGSTEQAASVQQLSASIGDIAIKTRENADKAEHAAALANTIKNNAEKGSEQMDEMIRAVKDISSASQSISKVIKVIDDIAFQTNILALNAAVEAARAGQHGKGFAVVAEEVRNLAAKSADAAKDTGGLIANSMEKAELGSRIAGETAESLSEIVQGINQSNTLVSEIAQASNEQSAGITQVNVGIEQVAHVIQQNSASAQESAAASQQMSSQSNILEDMLAQFKLKDNRTSGRFTIEAPRSPAPADEKLFLDDNNGRLGKY